VIRRVRGAGNVVIRAVRGLLTTGATTDGYSRGNRTPETIAKRSILYPVARVYLGVRYRAVRF